MPARMAWSGVSLLFLLLLGLSITSSYNHCKPPAGETAYQMFLRQHYNDPKTASKDYCNKLMHERCLTNRDPPFTKCKETNSIIHATKNMIIDVCSNAGAPYGNNQRVSNRPFRVTTCKNQGNPAVHPCEYRGSETTRIIVIACEGGNPVHFAEGIVVPTEVV